MKIAIITGLFNPEFGGMAGHAYQVAKYLAHNGHTVYIFARKSKCTIIDEQNIRTIPLLTHRFPFLDSILLRIRLWRYQPDWVHFSEAGIAYPCITDNYPSLVRVVGNDFLKPWAGFNLPLRFLLYRIPSPVYIRKLRSFEVRLRKKIVVHRLKKVQILTNSNWTMQKLMKHGVPFENVYVLPGGIDINLFKPAKSRSILRKEFNLPKDRIVFITVANLIERKGHDVVIEAIEQIVKNNKNIYYLIVGNGEYRTVLEKMVKQKKLNDYVQFTGKRAQQTVAKYYQASDIYIQISRNVEVFEGIKDNAETMGRTFIEAGACGLPVIASNIGGIPSVVTDGDNGILVHDPKNINEIIDKMVMLANNQNLRKKLGKRGIERAKTEFSWGVICKKIESLMRTQLNK